MITTVTLNAAIDKTYYLPHFARGAVSRAKKMIAVPGGKGINVARVIHQLGNKVVTTGYLGGSNGQFVRSELDKLGIEHDFVEVAGESRLCLNIIDEADQSSTELLEPGPIVQTKELETMKQRIEKLAMKSSIVTLSGSAPEGVPSGIYAELIEIAKRAGAQVFLDTSGKLLVEGIAAQPFLIKPNEDEIEILIGKKLKQESDLYEGIQQLMQSGIGCVVVTLGPKGSVVGYNGELLRISAPRIDCVNAVGCGDAFIAGIAYAVSNDRSILDGLRLATAAATANALTDQAGFVRMDDVERLLPLVEIETIRGC